MGPGKERAEVKVASSTPFVRKCKRVQHKIKNEMTSPTSFLNYYTGTFVGRKELAAGACGDGH